GEHDSLGERSIVRLGAREAERGPEGIVVRRQRGDRPALGGRDGTHVVVVAGDFDAAIIVAHARDEVCDERGRIRSPVAVMPAVEGARGAEDGELEAGNTPLAEHELSAPARMHGSVAEEPGVTRERRCVRLEDLSQVARAGLFLTLEEDLQVYRLLN